MEAQIYRDKVKAWCIKNVGEKREDWDEGMLYAYDVYYGDKYTTSYYMKLQAFKFLLMLFKSKTIKDYDYKYDVKSVNKIINVWPKVFILTQGKYKGRSFDIHPNQAFKIAAIWGFRHSSEPNKILTEYFYDVEGRKQGKSEFISAVSVLTAVDPLGIDAAAEIYFSGPVKETSNILYNKASKLIKNSPLFQPEFVKNNRVRIETEDGAKIKDLPFEVASLEGKNPSLGVLTEYHLHPNDDMFSSFDSARNDTRYNFIIFFDTTKGNLIEGVAYKREKRYKAFLQEQYDNPQEDVHVHIFSFIAELDEEDDIEDSTTWEKANPMMNVTMTLDQLKKQWSTAKSDPRERNEFITKKLGRWVSQFGSMLTDADMEESHMRWAEDFVSVHQLKGQPCYIMVDLAKSNDLNAVSLLFKDNRSGEEIAIFHSQVFIPSKTVRQREAEESVDYTSWIDKGYVRTSGDKAVDYADICGYINFLIREFDVQKILYDQYQWATVDNILKKLYKIPESLLEEVSQSVKELSSPMNLGMKKIFDKQLVWFGHPHVRYQFLNVIPSTFNGQVYFSKNKQTKKIDSFATYITGMARWLELKQINQGERKEVSWEL